MFSEIQKKKVAHFFNVLDVNKNGKLQVDDFVKVAKEIINQLELDPNSRTAKLILIKANRLFVQFLIDTDQAEMQVDLWDWMKFFENQLSNESGTLHNFIHRTTFHIFALFDHNKDRFISQEEYANMWSVYGLNGVDCNESFEELDTNNDSLISSSEMIEGLRLYFHSNDANALGNKMFGRWY